MKQFTEVDVIHRFSPDHPDYKKPDIGTEDTRMFKQLISWMDVHSCMECYETPEWTRIVTPLGISIIDMPYEQVCEEIKKSRDQDEKENEIIRSEYKERQQYLFDSLKTYLDHVFKK